MYLPASLNLLEEQQRPTITPNSFTLEWQEIGELVITSGRVVACDYAFIEGQGTPFLTYIGKGKYPVILCVTNKQTIALAMVRISDENPVRWEMAIRATQDVARLQNNEFFGYAVDSGRGCFADPVVADAITRNPDLLKRVYEAVDNNKLTWSISTVDENTGANIITFQSGYGDGSYPSYFGYDVDNEIVCLVTDFDVLNPRPSEELDLLEVASKEIRHHLWGKRKS